MHVWILFLYLFQALLAKVLHCNAQDLERNISRWRGRPYNVLLAKVRALLVSKFGRPKFQFNELKHWCLWICLIRWVKPCFKFLCHPSSIALAFSFAFGWYCIPIISWWYRIRLSPLTTVLLTTFWIYQVRGQSPLNFPWTIWRNKLLIAISLCHIIVYNNVI